MATVIRVTPAQLQQHIQAATVAGRFGCRTAEVYAAHQHCCYVYDQQLYLSQEKRA